MHCASDALWLSSSCCAHWRCINGKIMFWSMFTFCKCWQKMMFTAESIWPFLGLSLCFGVWPVWKIGCETLTCLQVARVLDSWFCSRAAKAGGRGREEKKRQLVCDSNRIIKLDLWIFLQFALQAMFYFCIISQSPYIRLSILDG